jgi:hypothetical protein
LKGGLKGVMVSDKEVAIIKKGRISKDIPKETTIVRALSPNEIDFDPSSLLTTVASDKDSSVF